MQLFAPRADKGKPSTPRWCLYLQCSEVGEEASFSLSDRGRASFIPGGVPGVREALSSCGGKEWTLGSVPGTSYLTACGSYNACGMGGRPRLGVWGSGF